MLDRMKAAARSAAVERQIRAALEERGLAQGATIRPQQMTGQERVTVLLGDAAGLSGPEVKSLERELQALDVGTVTVVSTAHISPPSEKRIASGHDNPLSLPGAKPVEREGGTVRARAAKQRPLGAARVLAVASGKGGVGKSTVAARLACALSARGNRVGLLDLDIYGPSLPILFDLEGMRPKVDDGRVIPLEAAGLRLMSIGFLVDEDQALAWRGPMVMGAAKQLLDEVRWGPLDWLIIDTPPGTGDAHITLMQRTRIDGALIVSTPSPLALADVRRGAQLFRRMEVPITGLVETMTGTDDAPSPFGPGLSEDALSSLGLLRLASIPLDAEIGKPIGRVPPRNGQMPFDKLAETIAHMDHFANAH